MKLELVLVLMGLVMFLLFGAKRGLAQFRGLEDDHLLVFRNLGGILAIIGIGILVCRTLSDLG